MSIMTNIVNISTFSNKLPVAMFHNFVVKGHISLSQICCNLCHFLKTFTKRKKIWTTAQLLRYVIIKSVVINLSFEFEF